MESNKDSKNPEKNSLSQADKEFSAFANKARRREILTWVLVPTFSVALISGAGYFSYIKNRSKDDVNISLNKFQKIASEEVKIEDLFLEKTNKEIVDDFNYNVEFHKLHNTQPNAKAFDTHLYIEKYFKYSIQTEAKYEKYLNFRFTNIELVPNSLDEIKISYSINWKFNEKANMSDSEKEKQTKKIKRYTVENFKILKRQSQFIDLINEKFDNNLKEKTPAVIAIISKETDPEKKFEYFNSNEFKKAIWDWFLEIANQSNIKPIQYKDYDITPYPFNENATTFNNIEWNPKKGLNQLTIDFCFYNKTTKLNSKGYRKIITIYGI
ncbi:hypothetical protein [Metamycoplasma hyosynoviae]|uniref:hypothetical protein n=1 Tax=Metamycoplasma hyosynoviae TaxID=29559 RepID=UPI002358F8C1|nr:hypothetical protein [Metamycoplasma hyosynoviae]MDC8962888.1 hypothetical protein [Metamycoplasma hyosynoviae]